MIRNFILLLILLISGFLRSEAQTEGKYKLTIEFDALTNTGNDLTATSFSITGYSANSGKSYRTWDGGGVKKDRKLDAPSPIVVYIPAGERLNKLTFWAKRTWKYYVPSKWSFLLPGLILEPRYDSDEGEHSLSLPNKPSIEWKYYTDKDHPLFIKFETLVTIKLFPVSINLYYYYDGAGYAASSPNPKPLLADESITLKATKGFVESTYHWQYRVREDEEWIDMPNHLQYSEGRASVTFKGSDLFDKKTCWAYGAANTKIFFRVNARTTRGQPESIILTSMLSAPRIKDKHIELETCHAASDASVTLEFDRALYPNEHLTLFQNGKQIGTSGIISMDAHNRFTIPNLPAGSYRFTLSGTYGKKNTYSQSENHSLDLTIPPRPPLQHAVAITPIHCHGLQDGAITVSANGGTGNFTTEFRSLGSPTTSTTSTFNDKTTFSNLSPGKYTITVHDSNGCSMKDGQNADVSHTVELTEPSTPVTVTLDESSIQKPRGHNTSDGAFALHAEGGTPKYKIQYFKNSDAISQEPTEIDDGTGYSYLLSGIPRGMYRAVVTDANFDLLAPEHKANPSGCKAELLYNLEAPPQLLASLRETLPVSCHGENDGALTVHAEGGVPGVLPPYTYTWYRVTDGQRTELRTAVDSVAQRLTSGIYLVRVTDGNDISQESELFTLEQPDTLQLTLDKKSPSCSGDHGYIKTLAMGGTPPYSYSWSAEGETASTLTTRTAGEYTVRVTDSRGCGSNGSAVLTAPNAIKATHSLSLPTCHGSANGSIALELSGGKPPYQIRWNDGIADSLARSGLQAGKYIASISDSTHCILRYPVQLEEPDPLHLTLNEPFSLCKGQSRMLTATSNTREASYRWLRNGEEFLETSNQLLVSFSGHYKVVATTPSGCKDSAETDIQLSPVQYALNVTAPSSASASAPIHAVNISHVPADRIEWKLPPEATVVDKSDAELIFSIATPGIYTLTAVAYKDACSTSMSQRIEIVGGSGITLPNGEETPLIKQFFIAPNPTKSRFSVHVELRESMDFTLSLYSAAAIVIARKQFRHTQAQSFEFELRDDAEGLYSVELRVGDERSLLKLIKLKN
jgi:putative PKD domain containing protein